MKRSLIILFSCFAWDAHAQNEIVELANLLKAPTSPGANLIGIAPADVTTPTDPTDLMLSIQSASNSFTTFPSSFAVDIAPGWMFFGNKIKYEELKEPDWKKSIWQNLVVSAAYTNGEDSFGRNSQMGLGFKVSLVRGKFSRKVDSLVELTTKRLTRITKSNDESIRNMMEMDSTLLALDSILIRYLEQGMRETDEYRNVVKRHDSLSEALYRIRAVAAELKTESSELKEIVRKMDFTRYGLSIDLSSGMVLAFPNDVFGRGHVQKAGLWLTGGYTMEEGLSILCLFRYLYNPDQLFADDEGLLKQDNLSTFDAGGRLVFRRPESKIAFSGEGIYRSVLEKTEVAPTWRFSISADYEISANKFLSLTFGRDYDATFSNDGNVIAALNFLVGLENLFVTGK